METWEYGLYFFVYLDSLSWMYPWAKQRIPKISLLALCVRHPPACIPLPLWIWGRRHSALLLGCHSLIEDIRWSSLELLKLIDSNQVLGSAAFVSEEGTGADLVMLWRSCQLM